MTGYLISVLALIAAEQAKMQAMIAHNQHCIATGQSNLYTEESFNDIVAELERLAIAVREF
jgi:hypothetical protein